MRTNDHDKGSESSQSPTSQSWLSELKNAEGQHVCNPKEFADLVDAKNPEWSKRLGSCASLISAERKTDDTFFAFIDEAAKLQEHNFIHLTKQGEKTVGFNINISDPFKDAEAKRQREDEAFADKNEAGAKASSNDDAGSYGPTAAERAYIREILEDKRHYLND